MGGGSEVVSRICEAAVDDAAWPHRPEHLSIPAGAQAVAFLMFSPDSVSWIASPHGDQLAHEFFAESRHSDTHADPLHSELYPGAGTMIRGVKDDGLQFTSEGFPSHAAAEAALAVLDQWRPHLARGLSLTAKLRAARASVVVDSLALAGIGAAIVCRWAAARGRCHLRYAAGRDDRRSHRAVPLHRSGPAGPFRGWAR